jgi:hypothetical protein
VETHPTAVIGSSDSAHQNSIPQSSSGSSSKHSNRALKRSQKLVPAGQELVVDSKEIASVHQGTGLGLGLLDSKEIASVHQGTAKARSQWTRCEELADVDEEDVKGRLKGSTDSMADTSCLPQLLPATDKSAASRAPLSSSSFSSVHARPEEHLAMLSSHRSLVSLSGNSALPLRPSDYALHTQSIDMSAIRFVRSTSLFSSQDITLTVSCCNIIQPPPFAPP